MVDSGVWKWKIGFLRGYGEAVWQEDGAHLRRITRIVAAPNGQAVIMKSFACIASADPDPSFRIDRMVIESRPASEELAADVERAWTGGVIQPSNGTMIHNFKR